METMTIATIMTSIGTIVTTAVTWVGDFVGVITSNPLLLLFVIFGFVGTGIGLLKRLMGV